MKNVFASNEIVKIIKKEKEYVACISEVTDRITQKRERNVKMKKSFTQYIKLKKLFTIQKITY